VFNTILTINELLDTCHLLLPKNSMSAHLKKHWPLWALLALYACAAAFTLACFDGTGDEGDSVHHYLFARYAPAHPALFMDHWAKPLYVLLACPFAQAGFVGAKVFNALAMMGAMAFTYGAARGLGLKNAAAGAALLMFAPLCYVLTFSGLTEPLFALFVAAGVYCAVSRGHLAACVLVSFLPFVRSEGLIVIGAFGLYFLLKKEWRLLPLLMLGHAAYAVAGYFAYRDLWWVFNKIPYATLGSVYGSGELSHFAVQLFYVVGTPIYVLFCLGLLRSAWGIFQEKNRREEWILVLTGFGAFFAFHSLAWHWGMFNSMGLNRVLVGVMPLIALVALQGLHLAAGLAGKNERLGTAVKALLMGCAVVFPFTPSPSALHWSRDLNLTKGQRVILRSAAFVRDSLGASDRRIVSAHPYVSEAYGKDHFDPAQRISLTPEYVLRPVPGDLVVWDYWMGLRENRVTKESLEARPEMKKVFEHEEIVAGRPVHYALYLVK
jgi:hypothetical protein